MTSTRDKKREYHRLLKDILNEFSKENKGKLIKHNKQIKIASERRHSKSVIEYEPDFSFKFKTGKKSFEYIIFEFLDQESYEGIISDIVECACIENCRLLFFLSHLREKHKEAEDLTDVIGDFLDRIKGEKVLEIINLHIPKEMINKKSKEIIKKEIFKQINKRVKLPSDSLTYSKSKKK